MNLLKGLRSRMVAGLTLLVMLFLVLATISIGSLRRQGAAITQEQEVQSRSFALMTALSGGIAEQIRVAEAYLSDPSLELAREFTQLGDSTHALQSAYLQLPGLTAIDRRALGRIASSQAELEVAYATARAYRDLGRVEEALRAAELARSPGDTLLASVHAVTASHQIRAEAQVAAFREMVADRQALVVALVALAVAMALATAYLTVRSVDAPLQELIASARRFGEGDLRPASMGEMPHELATLAHSIGAMGGRLRGVIESTVHEARGIGLSAGDLSAMSEELAASSHEIVKAIGAVSAGAEQQAREVRNAEALLSQLREASAQDFTATARVLGLTDSTRTLAARHAADLEGSAGSLAQLRTEVRRAASEARELTRLVDRIKELQDLAGQLASESDVLALNASVEAAREGAGAGFTAVAEETQRLAASSRSAAERVAEVVEAIRGRSSALQAALYGAASRATEGEATANRSAVAFQEIGRLVEAMQGIATRVARSAEESKQVGARFAELRRHLETIAQENVVATEAVTAAATQQSQATDDIASSAAGLLEASERLTTLMAGFRT